MEKSPEAFRTISEVADWLGVPTHVLRFWESRFTQVKPVKRAGGRRYYRPSDMELIGGIKRLLHDDGMTIRGVQKLLREKGVRHVASLSQPLYADVEDAEVIEATISAAEEPQAIQAAPAEDDTVVAFERPQAEAPEPVPEEVSDEGPEAAPEAAADEAEDTAPAAAAAEQPLPPEPVQEPEPAPEEAERAARADGDLFDRLAPEAEAPATAETPEPAEAPAPAESPERPEVAESSPEPAEARPPAPVFADAEPEDEDSGDDDLVEEPALSTASRLRIAAQGNLSAHAETLALAQARLVALRDRMDGRG